MAISRTCLRRLNLAAVLITVVGGLAAVPAIAGPSPWVRFIATELENEATLLPDLFPATAPSAVDALLQARIYASPSGQYWASEVITLQNGTTNRAAISGTRTTIDFALSRLQNIPGLNVAFEASASGIDSAVLVNSAGDISISGNLTGTTTNDEAIILYSRTTGQFSFVAREGSPIPTLTGENYGTSLDQRSITEDGQVLFRDGATAGALPSSQDEFLFLGGAGGAGFAPIVQGGVVVPTGQSIQPNVVMPDIELGFGVSNDGQNYITRGILQRTAPNVVAIRNGAVVLEQGQPLPGAGEPTPEFSTALAITDAGMGPGGDWYVAGRALPTGTGMTTAPWLVFNNRIIYTADADFPGGLPGERVNNLSGISITTRGDLFICVSTVPDGLGFSRTIGVVIPVVGEPIVAFESGTPIDFNRNNDPADDFWFVSTVFSAAMADDGTVYLITRYLNIGDVIGYVPVTLPSTAPVRCNAADIAYDDGSPLPPVGVAGGTNNGVTEGDYNLFFGRFFDADLAVDIANDDGSPLPPFGTLTTNNGVTEADYNLFFSIFFDGCAF